MTAPQPPRIVPVTRAEKAVLDELMRHGARNRAIAAALHLSEDTVKSHLQAVGRRTLTASRTELVVALFRGRVQVRVDGGARRKATPSTKPIDHGTWGGFLAHHRRDEPMCAPCRAAGDAQVAKMQAARKTAA